MAARPVPRVALLAIHPEHARAILEGRKLVEFRKRRLANSIDVVLLYATAPTRRVIGYFEVANQDSASPTSIWERHGLQGCISRTLFRGYYAGSSQAVAVVISRAKALEAPLELRELGVATPPQSFQYLSARDVPLSARLPVS